MIDPKDSLHDTVYSWITEAARQTKGGLETLHEIDVAPNPLKVEVGFTPAKDMATVWADDGELSIYIQFFIGKSGAPGWTGFASAHGRKFPFKGAGQRTDPLARFVEEVLDVVAVTIDDKIYGQG